MNTRLALASVTALAFAACDSGNAPVTAEVQPSIVITEQNAIDVAAAVYGMFDLVRIARSATNVIEVPLPDPVEPSGILVRTIPGPQGGECVFTWFDRDVDLEYSTGDAFAISFADFSDAGLVLTGAIVLDDVELVGNVHSSAAWMLTGRLDFVSLRVVSGAFETTLNGSMSYEREERWTVLLMTLVADREIAYAGRVLHSGSMLARNDYKSESTMALFADAMIDDAVLGGVLGFATEQSLTGIQALPNPSIGALTVHGANESVMDVAAIDFFNAELQVDLEGDEEVDVILPVEWVEL